MTENHSNSDGQSVEQTDSEEASIMIADPDDYQKTKKLKAINDTKEHVMELKRNRSDRITELSDRFVSDGVDVFQNELATGVADYGNELLPLIEEALEKELLDESDLDVDIPNGNSQIPLIEFIMCNGEMRGKGEATHLQHSMAVYRQLQRIERKLGLGLDLEEEQSPAEI